MLKPSEKLLIYGSESLSDAELLAIIIHTGSKRDNVIVLATKLLVKYGSLTNLLDQSIEELCKNDGIGQAKAIKIKTIKQINLSTSKVTDELVTITCPKDVYNICRSIATNAQEHLVVICLNTKNNVISINDVFRGTINQIVIHPREVFYPAVQCLANSVILVHNHPTGDVTPSLADIETTRKLVNIGEMLGIPLIEHVIVGGESYRSIMSEL